MMVKRMVRKTLMALHQQIHVRTLQLLAHLTLLGDHLYRASWKLGQQHVAINLQLRCDPSFDLLNPLLIQQLQLPETVGGWGN